MPSRFEIIVIGGGHAGVEAAWAAANFFATQRGSAEAARATVALVTMDPSKIGVMSCNPAIGGLAKGQIVREIDALGGLMARAADATGIMFHTLNLSKGPAVRGPRAQCDKHAYAEEVQRLIAGRPEIVVVGGNVEEIVVERGRVAGVKVRQSSKAAEQQSSKEERDAIRSSSSFAALLLCCSSVVLTTGTFMRALMHQGEQRTPGGRVGEGAANAISGALASLGFELGRLKTGTPPRLGRGSIRWDDLEPQRGDDPPAPFSELTPAVAERFPAIEQIECRVTRTTRAAHDAIRANLHRAPMFNGQIESSGPRYCPSIEDKVVRFADRDSHHVFLEPESLRDGSVYANGVSTSLPADVQERIVRAMPGCENAEILRHGYAVEYDMVRPHQIDAGCMTRNVEGLFLAGQINGTSGYEEAAGQGVVAGINAARFAAGLEPFTLARDSAYIGVMLDDLVTKTPVEPYRMFTSRAEHRLLLRSDNAADRLTPLAVELGALSCAVPHGRERLELLERKQADSAALERLLESCRIDGVLLADVLRRPDFTEGDFRAVAQRSGLHPSAAAIATVYAERQYEGYIARQRAEARRQSEMEHRRIPRDLDLGAIPGLRSEARHVLSRFRPSTVGQASRLEGVNPADVSLVLVAMRRRAAGA